MDFGLSGLNSDMGSNEDYESEYSDPDACLNLVDRLEKYVESEHMYSRQLAARSLLETLQQVDEFADAERVLRVLSNLANDSDGVVRTELCEQLAQIGNVCVENRTIFTNGDISYDPLTNDILPVIYRYMTDQNNQVRKTSQAALADLVEQRLVTTEDIVSKISPIISKLADVDSPEEHRSEAASLICRLAPIINTELTEQLFLGHFVNLCTDHIFQIRKICAINFGIFCQVVGREKTESLLLEKFFCLCADAIWGVRKACSECFMQVSLVCSPDVRHSQLSAVFISLVADQSRWVRMAAFEALGGFISTFADPSMTGLRLTDEGTLVISEPSLLLDEKRRNGDMLDGIERLDDVKDEKVAAADDDVHSHNHVVEEQIEIETNSDGNQVACDVQPIDQSSEKLLNLSQSLHSDTVSERLPRDTFYAENCVDTLDDSSEGQNNELIIPNKKIRCDDEHCTDALEVKRIEKQHPDEGNISNTPLVLQNGIEDLDCSDNVLENCTEEEMRWSSMDVENKIVDVLDNEIENVLTDENLSVADNIAATSNPNAFDLCQRSELSTDQSDNAVDTLALDNCLENNRSSAETMTQQFGSLNFWQKIVPELGKTSHLDGMNDVLVQNSEEDSLVLCSDVMPADHTVLSSKLLDSISHLNDSVTGVNGTSSENHIHHGIEVENGEVELHGQFDRYLDESNPMDNVESAVGISVLEADGSVELEEGSSVVTGKCDQENDAEIVLESDKQFLTLIDASKSEEISLHEEFTNNARNDEYKPLLQLLDDLTGSKNSPMDILDLENGVEVDEEEIRELVAAAKDMPCNDIAIYEQDVVPSDLLEQYLSMMDPCCAQKVDSEITRHCAYSLPAVAYTLGRKNWSSLKNLYVALAADVQWKVRRTLAFSIHELALIVGEEITSRDLVPVFDGFLNDLDEVRIGVLKHLADFLKLLPMEARRGYLLKITELLKTDNSRNWRFREELARQLFLLLNLFTVTDIQEHISPIALHLAEDRVAQVRLAAVRVLSHIVKQLVGNIEGSDGHCIWLSYLEKLNEQFARSGRCIKRQMYVQLCNCVLHDRVISEECFADKFLPVLLSLSHDAIPNVRLTLARTIAQHIKHSEFFLSSKNPYHEELEQTIAAFQEDQDRDVRFLINIRPCDDVVHGSVEIVP